MSNMTFEHLSDLCVAIWARDVVFKYSQRVVAMTVEPNYGVDSSVKGKAFDIELIDFIYVCSSNISELANKGYTEFISWGSVPEACCRGRQYCQLLNNYLEETISKPFTHFTLARSNLDPERLKGYRHYYFHDAMGDGIEVVCRRASVRAR